MNRHGTSLTSGGRWLATVALTFTLSASIGSTAAAAGGQTEGKLSVTSTLYGMKTLPSQIQWIATPKPLTAALTEVDFLIDGKVIWIEHTAPYVFGGDDNGLNEGSLVTTWLSPGTHRFTVRAMGDAGTATQTVTAKVHAAPPPPKALRGTWTRTVTPADLTRAVPEHPVDTGRWELVFDRAGAWELDPSGGGPGGSGRIYAYSVKGHTINLLEPIQEAPCSQTGPCGISRYGHQGVGDVDCNPSGPFGSYHWSVSGKTLTLAPIPPTLDGCGQREDVWTGQWTLTSPKPPPQ